MRNFLIPIILLISFSYGLFLGIYQVPPFEKIVSLKNLLSRQATVLELNEFSKCNLPKSFKVESNSHAFIGHAYGSPKNSSIYDFVSLNTQNFINQNSDKLNTIIFTGDVFNVPSIEKWELLRKTVGENIDIYIAPGNHDVIRPDSLDIFKMSEFGKQPFPFIRYLDGTPLIIDNSVLSNWEVSNSIVEFVNKVESSKVIIARHNIPAEDLTSLANGQAYKSNKLESVEQLVKKFDKDKSFYWIIGDSGASEKLPRLSCLVFDNHTFLVNGLGQVNGDSLILYHENNFSEFVISSSEFPN